jgi:glycosyltransferase involved in cell wall biosynthesis
MENGSSSVPQLISVIVPVHNGEKFLGEALTSIFAQDYRPIEVIVVDDGSTDGTGAIARSYPEARYFYEGKQGSATAKNTGIENSRGELVAFLDADDLWLPSQLTIQAAYLSTHPEVGCVCGRMKNFLEPGVTCPPWIDPETLLQPSDINSLCSTLVRRSLFDKVGKLNPSYLQSEDLEWFFRMKECGIPIYKLVEPVLLRRIHENNISHNQMGSVQSRLRMLKESIDRKRGAVTRTPGAL